MKSGNSDDGYEDENDNIVDYSEQDEDGMYDVEEYKPRTRSRRSFSEIEKDSPYASRNLQTKVIPMNNGLSSARMVITQPTCYEDVEELGAYLKNKKSIIVNLENVGKEDARRIVDFLSGSAFMIDGTIQKVSNLIYLIAPRTVEVQNDLERSELNKQKASFSWLK